MYYDIIQKYKKEAIALISLLFILAVIYMIITLVGRIGKLEVPMHIVPHTATVFIDEKPINHGTLWLTPGTYKAAVQAEGFKTVDTTLVVTPQKKTSLSVSLFPVSDEARAWAEKNKGHYKKNERYVGAQAQEDGRFFAKQYPIVSRLPFQDPYYRIAYRSDDDNKLTLTITTPSPRYRYVAVQKIREFGYDPTDFMIDFVDYKSPLVAKENGV